MGDVVRDRFDCGLQWRETLVSRLPLRSPVWRIPMANKSSKKVAEKSLKEKRLAKKAKKAQHTNESFDSTFGH